MNTHVNVDARAFNTVSWLLQPDTTFAVPVYQRQYRWTTDGCAKLLDDIRAIAAKDDHETHFMGSVLTTRTTEGDLTEVVLIDGQQRITTLMLLVAALHEVLAGSDAAVSGQLRSILDHPFDHGLTRLRPHSYRASAFEGIVFGRELTQDELDSSFFDENYAFFREAIRDDSLQIWRGLQKLEHVEVGLTNSANPQQVFESINSTGAPLRNNELIHNYVLMGLGLAEQAEIETSHWIPIEENTGVAIDDFLRDYLILLTGRDADFAGEHGTYNAFKQQYPMLKNVADVRELTEELLRFSKIYRRLLNPAEDADADLRRQVGYVNVFGRAMYPLLLGLIDDFEQGKLDKYALIQIAESLQSLFLRKMTVGESRDHLIAQLCRRRNDYPLEGLARNIQRRTPSDGRVRNALKYAKVPHVGYVLRRLEPEELNIEVELEIEHIFPATQTSVWSGDGVKQWGTFSEEEKAKYREILNTLGNFTLLEQPLNARASNKSFAEKRPTYLESAVPTTRALSEVESWNSRAIEERTQTLTDRFLEVWAVPGVAGIESNTELTPVLDVAKKPGWYKGWRTEYEYVQFRGETWEVRNIKDLFRRLFQTLWQDPGNRARMLDVDNRPIAESVEWNSQWERLGDSHYLFMALFPQYMLAAVQSLVDTLNIADDLMIKFSSVDE